MSTKPLITMFHDDLNAVVDKYRDQGLTIGEGIGVLEIVKLDLWHETREDGDDDSGDNKPWEK